MNVIFGVALAALIIGSVLIQHWPVIEALSGGAAAFLGALVGAAAGLGAILVGALYNAKLIRDENQRLRREEARTIAIAFRAELRTLMSDAATRLLTLKNIGEAPKPIAATTAAQLDISVKPVYANNTHRLGDLGDRVALSVVDAHGTADHIRHNVVALLAQPLGNVIREGSVKAFRVDFGTLIRGAAAAINALDEFLGDPERYPDPKALAAAAAAKVAAAPATQVAAEAGLAAADTPAEPAEPDAAPTP